ncbi:MAG: hypothetical protein KF715_18820 [Candidatus Didemnitutus sp.]|nr:hypothetical protein [Candidatus Didemnitutus sp.]
MKRSDAAGLVLLGFVLGAAGREIVGQWKVPAPRLAPTVAVASGMASSGSPVAMEARQSEGPGDWAAWASTSPGGAARRRVSTGLVSWLERDRDAALAWVRAQPPGVMRNDLWTIALGALAEADAPAALQLARSEVGGETGRRIAEIAYRAWARRDGGAAVADASTRLNGLPRVTTIEAIVGEWATHDPAATIDWIRAQTNDPRQEALLSVALQGMVQSEPELAAACIVRLGDGPLAQQAAASLSARWVVEDLAAARAWASQLPPGDLRRAVEASMLPGWIEQDPAGAAAHWREFSPSNSALEQLARQWGAVDFAAASRWAESLSSAERAEFVNAAVAQRALDAPVEAAQLALQLPADEGRERALISVAVAWANSDPAAATTWLSGVAGEATRRRAVRDIMPVWASTDPVRAWQWLQTLPAGSVRDEAVAAYRFAQPNRG